MTRSRSGLKVEMLAIISELPLEEIQRQFLESRWLDQLLWLNEKASRARSRYYSLRLVTIIGGVVVPALISQNNAGNSFKEIFGWLAFGLSQLVAISAAVEELFHYGENHRRYRNSAESLKTEGWEFFQLSNRYSGKTYAEAYPIFASNVEAVIRQDVEGYISLASQEKKAT